MTETSFVVSSPAKVILFGEHASVYGKKAIAGSIDLRLFIKTCSCNSVQIKLNQLFEFKLDSLPKVSSRHLYQSDTLDDTLVVSLEKILVYVSESSIKMALLVFLYGVCCLSKG
jgi:mevalonate kinase